MSAEDLDEIAAERVDRVHPDGRQADLQRGYEILLLKKKLNVCLILIWNNLYENIDNKVHIQSPLSLQIHQIEIITKTTWFLIY